MPRSVSRVPRLSCFRVSSQTEPARPGRDRVREFETHGTTFGEVHDREPFSRERLASKLPRGSVRAPRGGRSRARAPSETDAVENGVERFPGASSSHVSGAGAASSSRSDQFRRSAAGPPRWSRDGRRCPTTLARPRPRNASPPPCVSTVAGASSGQRAGRGPPRGHAARR